MIPAADIPHVPTCGCNGCHPLQPALWSVYGNLYGVDSVEALRVMKADGDPSLLDDPFIELELQIAALLASVYGVRALQAKRVLEEALTPPLNQREVDIALGKAGEILGDVFDRDTELEIRRLVNRLIIRGALVGEGVDPATLPEVEPDIPLEEKPPLSSALENEETGGYTSLFIGGALLAGAAVLGGLTAIGRDTSLLNVPTVRKVHEGIVHAARYYTNQHFNRIILPEIQGRVNAILGGADPATVPGFNDINQYLSRRLQNVPYWRVVANGAASRAYHYGVMKAGALRQFRGYEIVAIIDDRTSDICLGLNGKRFLLNETVDLLEKAIDTEDAEEFTRLLPWVPNAATVEGRSPRELRDLGYVVPPFHPNCRSTIRFI